MKKIFMITIIAAISTCTCAQTLDELIRSGLENNPLIKKLELEYLAASERGIQVSEMPDPEIGLGTFLLPVETRVGAQKARFSATHMFPWKGTLPEKRKLEDQKAEALYERIEAQALNLAYDIRQAYYSLYEISKRQDIIRQNLTLLEALENLALTKVEAGKATAADVLRVQLKIEELEQEIEMLSTDATKPRAAINQLLNRPTVTEVLTADSLQFAPLPYQVDSLRNEIREYHPMLKMFDLRQEVAKQAIEVNKLEGKPLFGVGLDYIVVDGRSGVDIPGNGTDIVQLRASVRIPLYRKKYDAREREEQFRIEALEQEKTDTYNRFIATVDQAFASHRNARIRYELYQRQEFLTLSAKEILEAAYSADGSRFDELLRLEQDLIDYELKTLIAIVDSHRARSTIDQFLNFNF